MLESVRIERFKSIDDTTIPLGRVTLLVGPNNSGKSSVLQAIQFGVSVVQSIILDGTNQWRNGESLAGTLSADQLIYTPLRDVQTLARGGALRQSPESQICVSFNAGATMATIAVRRGKNRNISAVVTGQEMGQSLQSLEQPFSVIAPGLAGIPSFEEYKSEGIVRRAAARGDANNVFRNVLWILRSEPVQWEQFCSRLAEVFPDVAIDVVFDARNDEHILATVTRSGTRLPIDSSGTGILQAAQVLAYIGVYRPRLLILDEPDSHLHPDNQRKLARILSTIAEEEDFQVLMSTYSRHLLDECVSLGATTHWMSSGSREAAPLDTTQALMELGALDASDRLRNGATPLVLLTEDSNTSYIETILAANGFAEREYSVWSYNNCTKLFAAKALGRFILEHAPGTLVLVHLDRDYRADEDVDADLSDLRDAGLHAFATAGTDIESCFLRLDHLLTIYSDQPREAVESLLEDATIAVEEASTSQLINARTRQAYANRRDGQSQPNVGAIAHSCMAEYKANPARFRHGKQVLKALNRLAQERFGRMRRIDSVSNALLIDELTAARTALRDADGSP